MYTRSEHAYVGRYNGFATETGLRFPGLELSSGISVLSAHLHLTFKTHDRYMSLYGNEEWQQTTRPLGMMVRANIAYLD
eukprot:SAG11_NODE_32811_length_280_cov_2.000000_1_plen_78_part_10